MEEVKASTVVIHLTDVSLRQEEQIYQDLVYLFDEELESFDPHGIFGGDKVQLLIGNLDETQRSSLGFVDEKGEPLILEKRIFMLVSRDLRVLAGGEFTEDICDDAFNNKDDQLSWIERKNKAIQDVLLDAGILEPVV